MRGLLARGYKAWPLRKVLEYHLTGRPIPTKTFVVTFDDGYACVYDDAWPILNELGIPATVFVTTAYMDSDEPFPFDDWSERQSDRVPATWWRPLATAQCAEMLAGGLVELGTHTHTHVDFRENLEELGPEIRTSLGVLNDRFELADATFAFPFGHCSAALRAEAKRTGVLCALTTRPELVSPDSNPFDWGRFTVESYDTAATLAAKLDGWYSVMRDVWHRYGRRTSRKDRLVAP